MERKKESRKKIYDNSLVVSVRLTIYVLVLLLSDELYVVYTTDSRISDYTTQSGLVLVSLYQLWRYF